MIINPHTLIDGYKLDHRRQMAPGVTKVFANFTPRKSYRKVKTNGIVWFGLQYLVKEYLIKQWNERFFGQPLDQVIARYTRRINGYLGPNDIGFEHIAQLHALGHLPIEIRALKEGSIVPYKVAPMVVWSTDDRFAWITTYLETIWSTNIWPMTTSATTAKQFRDILDQYAKLTVGDTAFVKWCGHNFSYRGCMGHEAACLVDAGHLLSFTGSDTIPGIDFMEEYYRANSDTELVSGSVPATEHAVMGTYGPTGEDEAFRRLITEIYPKGIVSIVSDTWDYWYILTKLAPSLKDLIMARDGKLVFRPDSGDNVKIIVGDPAAPEGTPEHRGTIGVLWDTFGGSINAQGFKVLDPHVGAILGDGVTLDVMTAICEGLVAKGFATTNLVYGIGSYTFQYGVSRDTDGWAAKSTFCVINGQPREIYKDPKTDKAGLKKSAKGLIAVYSDGAGSWTQKDQASWDEVLSCAYEPVFKDGVLLRDQSLAEIRTLIHPSF